MHHLPDSLMQRHGQDGDQLAHLAETAFAANAVGCNQRRASSKTVGQL